MKLTLVGGKADFPEFNGGDLFTSYNGEYLRKVVYSEAKDCYIIVDPFASSTERTASHSRGKTATAAVKAYVEGNNDVQKVTVKEIVLEKVGQLLND